MQKKKKRAITYKVAAELSAIVNYCWAVKFPGIQASKDANVCYHMSSLSECRAGTLKTQIPKKIEPECTYELRRHCLGMFRVVALCCLLAVVFL